MKDILDGRFVGELTPEEVISQFQYRAGIHQSYIELLEKQPDAGWEAYGTKEWHDWAVNGYEWGIRHIEERPEKIVEIEKVIEVEKCSLNEAFETILLSVWHIFRK